MLGDVSNAPSARLSCTPSGGDETAAAMGDPRRRQGSTSLVHGNRMTQEARWNATPEPTLRPSGHVAWHTTAAIVTGRDGSRSASVSTRRLVPWMRPAAYKAKCLAPSTSPTEESADVVAAASPRHQARLKNCAQRLTKNSSIAGATREPQPKANARGDRRERRPPRLRSFLACGAEAVGVVVNFGQALISMIATTTTHMIEKLLTRTPLGYV